MKEYQSFYEVALKNFPNGSVNIIDRNFKVLFAEGKELRETGQNFSAIGKSVFELYEPSLAKKVADYYNQTFEGKEVTFELLFDDKYYTVNTLPLPSNDKNGKIQKIMIVAQNTTGRKLAEKKIVQSERLYHGLFDKSPMPMLVHDEQNYKILDVNDAAISHYGYSKEEFLEMDLDQLYPSVQEIQQTLSNFIAGPDGFKKEVHSRKDGSIFYSNVARHPMELNGLPAKLLIMIDITDRYRVERKLEESYRTLSGYKKALDLGSIMTISDMRGCFLYVNDNYCKVSGYNRAELIGKSTQVQKCNAFNKNVITEIRKLLLKGEVWNGELKNEGKNGNFYWLDATIVPLTNDEGKPNQFLIISNDITEKKEASERVQKSEAALKEAQRIAKMGNWGYDLKKDQFIWSDEMFRILNKKPSDSPPSFKSIMSEMVSEDIQVLKTALHDTLRKGKKHNLDLRFNLKDGTTRYINVMGDAKKDEHGNITRIFGTALDITKRKEAEEKLQESELWFRTIFNTSRDGYIVELEENVCYVNDALVKLLGYNSQDELLGHNVNVVLANNADQKDIEEYSKRRLKGIHTPYNYETKGKCKNGEIIDIEVSATVFEVKGKKYIIALIRDISERKKAERNLQNRNDELHKINAELDRFVYSASHDLRAPLSSVLGLVNIAKKETDVNRKLECLDLIAKSIHKLDFLVHEIIEFSRNSRTEIKTEKIDIRVLIKESFENFQYLENAFMVQTKIQVHEYETLYADKSRLVTIMNNLISNAIRYCTPEKGAPFIYFVVHVTEEEVTIKVKDNGRGIAKEHIEKVFNMFYRADEDKVGSGLGLYIVQEAVNKLQGEISVESEQGEYTEFTIKFPNKL